MNHWFRAKVVPHQANGKKLGVWVSPCDSWRERLEISHAPLPHWSIWDTEMAGCRGEA